MHPIPEFQPAPKPKIYPFDSGFLKWIRRQRCVACGYPGGWDPIEAAHLDSCRYGDVGNVISLHGWSCHREGPESIHRMGKVKFAERYGLDLRAEAEKLASRYLAERH